jgi:hypothetical protein
MAHHRGDQHQHDHQLDQGEASLPFASARHGGCPGSR